MMTNHDKIEIAIQNENYFLAIELLLAEFSITKDPANLETIHNILSNHQISNRFTNEHIESLNKILSSKKFDLIKKGIKENKIGIAEFPVVGKNNNSNEIRAIVVTEGADNIGIDPKIDNKKELVTTIRFVQDEIQKNLCDVDGTTQDITILNWGNTFSIREHLLKGTNLEPNNNNFKVDGTSLHFAAVVSLVSKIFSFPINPNYIFTGALSQDGHAQRIEYLELKANLIVKERPNTQKIFIPPKIKFTEPEQNIISLNNNFVEVENVYQLIEKVFDKNFTEIAKISIDVRKKLGRARIWAEHIGERSLEFKKDWGTTVHQNFNCIVLHFVRQTNDDYKIFPLNDIYHKFENGNNNGNNLIILNLGVANHYTGHMIDKFYRQFPGIIGIRKGKDSKDVIIFAEPKGGYNLLGFECICNFF
jgi:hypothetical protein